MGMEGSSSKLTSEMEEQAMLNRNRLAMFVVISILVVAASGCLGIACSCPNGDETNGDNGDNGEEEIARIIFGSLRDAPSSPDHPDYEDFSGAYYKYSELYTMRADGSDVQQLTDNKYYEMQADVSPDGSKIVCSIHYSWQNAMQEAEPDPGWEIAVMDIDGTNLKNLTDNDYLDVGAHWNHDGTKIVYLADSAHRKPDQIIGDENYVQMRMDVYTMDDDGSNVEQLTFAEPGEIYADPSFSFSEPSKILYIHDDDGSVPQNYDLYVMDANGENPELILQHDDVDPQAIAINDPMFSPDGSTIILEAEMGVNEWDHVIYHMFTVDANGGNVRKITQGGMEVSEGIPQFSPDGMKIAYDRVVWTSGTEGTREIWLANADGSDEERLSSYAHEMEASWFPLADDG
jgi:Tol biopolymer transport system component